MTVRLPMTRAGCESARETLCSCGCAEPHVIMYRTTADDARLALWSDGAVTHGRGGTFLRGLGTPRSEYRRRWRAQAVRLVADNVSLFDAAELPHVVKLAEQSYRHTYSSDVSRRTDVVRLAVRKLRNKVC